MAGNATLIPQSIRSALKQGGIPDDQKWEFVEALMEYDLTGTIPEFSNESLAMLFESYRFFIDSNNARYEEKAQRLSLAGRMGGSTRSEAKAATARKNGARGGTPRGNRNAAKNNPSNPSVESRAKEQPKQMLGLIEKTTQANKISKDKNSSSSSVVFSKQPTTTISNFINECVKAGFHLDEKIFGEILAENPIDPAWLSGPFNFVEFASDVIEERYSAKPSWEQKLLFVSAFAWEDLREEFPAWRERHKQEGEEKQRREAVETEQHRIAEARRNPPAVCGHCGTALAPDIRSCPSCGWILRFDEDAAIWEFDEPLNFDSIREIFKSKAGGAGP
jgi:hypothetical protein